MIEKPENEKPQFDGWILDDRISPGNRLHQGDLVIFKNADPLRTNGLVVTADCDLDKRKHGRLITLVPIVSVATVVEHYLLLDQLNSYQDQLTSFVFREFALSGTLSDPIVAAELRSKINDAQNDTSADLPCLAAKGILHELDEIKGPAFCALMKAINIPIDNLSGKLQNQLASKGDLVALPVPSFLSDTANIVWVRPVWQVPLREIVWRNSEINEKVGVRIARLDSPYRYRVTQVMGQVFSDIGTPDVKPDYVPVIKGVLAI